ncbi:MAG TPA: hypothetical protein VER58_00505 [Thermoanaerobaculia bacterium]|nr:hypothetical protein [Thermoanaerobaculia bacterium]
MSADCQRYAENPEANASHLRDCLACREMYALLDTRVESKAMAVDALPLAEWEGADYRSWPLVIGGALALLTIAFSLCMIAGISFFTAMTAGARFDWRGALAAANNAVRPLGPIGFAAAFLVVNTLLVLLLRRSPRGIDA